MNAATATAARTTRVFQRNTVSPPSGERPQDVRAHYRSVSGNRASPIRGSLGRASGCSRVGCLRDDELRVRATPVLSVVVGSFGSLRRRAQPLERQATMVSRSTACVEPAECRAPIKRSGRDSNPRARLRRAGCFQGSCIQPDSATAPSLSLSRRLTHRRFGKHAFIRYSALFWSSTYNQS